MVDGRKSLKNKMRLAILTERIDVAGPDVDIFKIKPTDGEFFSFVAGQYATLGLEVGDEFIARAYSIASSPYTRDYLEFYINVIREGQLTPALFDLCVGDEVYYMGPKGLFTLAKTTKRNLLFVATGTGLAPYVSMLRTLRADQCAGKPHAKIITLVHGVRYSQDLGYRGELEVLTREEAFDFLYLPTVSRADQDQSWTPDLGRGRVTGLLSAIGEDVAGQRVPALPQGLDLKEVLERFPSEHTAVYLCGNPDMIVNAKSVLTNKGYGEIHTEEYW